jgi:hypothetical protein
VRNEFEIGDVSTDFSKRTSWWAREDLGRARTWKSMKNGCVCLMYTNTINYYKCIELISFWKKLGASWTKRWCPRSPNWYRSSNGHIIRVKQNADTKTFKSGSISIGFAWDRMQNWWKHTPRGPCHGAEAWKRQMNIVLLVYYCYITSILLSYYLYNNSKLVVHKPFHVRCQSSRPGYELEKI